MTGSNNMKAVTSRILRSGNLPRNRQCKVAPNQAERHRTNSRCHPLLQLNHLPASWRARNRQSCGSDSAQRSPWSAGPANAAPSHHILLRSSKRAFTRSEGHTATFCEAIYRNTPPERGSAAPTPNAAPVLTTFHTLCIKINVKPLRRFLKRILIL